MIATAMVAGAQQAGGVCAYVDAGHQLDTEHAVAAGVKLDDLLVSQPDTAEQAAEIVDTLVRTGALDLVVVAGFVGVMADTVTRLGRTETVLVLL